MPVVIPFQYFEGTFSTTLSTGGTANTVIAWSWTTAPNQGLMDTVSIAFSVGWKAFINSGSTYLGARFLVGVAGGPPTIITSTGGTGVGARAGALATPQVMGLIRKNTNIASRKGIGRIFVPNIVETNVLDTGALNATEQTALQGVATAIAGIAGISGIDEMVLLHSDGFTTPTVVTSLSVETKVSTLRSRYTR